VPPTQSTLSVHGLHHVTAIAGDPQENLDFYVGVLGLRLVKKSVNQDVPDTYHLFYADGAGTPGTDLTFFPWPRMPRARRGIGLAVEVAFEVPAGSLAFWHERLEAYDVLLDDETERFGERVLSLRDPHGLPLVLVEVSEDGEADGSGREWIPWRESPVPVEHQLRGMHSVRLWERDLAATVRLLTEVMGFEALGEEGGWHRFGVGVGGGGSGRLIDLKELPEERRGAWGTGGIHHVAWRVEDSDEEMALRQAIEEHGLVPTPQIDRFWFRSVYFKEPGGVLFELATAGPGFAEDEPAEHLGETLVLPPWLEDDRAAIEAALPPLAAPREAGGE